MNWHVLPLSEVFQLLKTGPNGLDQITAEERLNEYGKNEIEEYRKKTPLELFLGQFKDFMILVLIAAALLSIALGEILDSLIILAIVLLNAVIGFIQEYRAEKALESLKKMAAQKARVLRDGKIRMVPASDLVPGDIVLLEAGDVIPADVRFIETHQLKVDESMLTGESVNVEKSSRDLPESEYALGDRVNMGYKGTYITMGKARAVVVATGMNTEFGRIARMIQHEEQRTPLQRKLDAFGKRLTVVILLLCAFIFFFGWWRGEDLLNMLLTAVSLAVAAIPEALPAMVVITLALGAKRLAKQNALIRKLPAVEALGSVTYICSDKTGTLTMNKMTVQEVFEISGEKVKEWFPEGKALLYAMALNNDAVQDKTDRWLGDSTEVAMARYAVAQGLEKNKIEKKFPRKAEVPFDSQRMRMTTVHQVDDRLVVIVKGAAEVIFQRLHPSQRSRMSEWNHKVEEMAKKGYRVLAFAVKELSDPNDLSNEEYLERDLFLIGLVGVIDPPRKEAIKAVSTCKQAGITPVMITGDHRLTAAAIARQLGIISDGDEHVIEGTELEKMPEKEFEKIVKRIRVYARVSPEHKLKIVKALQHKHQVVAMTGDGVNDAPALKNADIGIAMGINGTEVAKESAHMILLDDNFATIVVAIKEGRRIFDNILKFIKYILTGNTGEISIILFAPMFNLPIPLMAIHILWVNLVTDGLPGLALASEQAEQNIMKRKPYNPRMNIFSGEMARHIILAGLGIAGVTLGVQAWAIHQNMENWQTMAFTVICFAQLGHVLAIRTGNDPLIKAGLLSNKPMLGAVMLTGILQLVLIYVPFFNTLFHTRPLSLYELMVCLLASGVIFALLEIEKTIRYYLNK